MSTAVGFHGVVGSNGHQPPDGYAAYAARLVATGLVTDPWVDGVPRFSERPLMLRARDHAALRAAAERVTAALHEVVLQVGQQPALLDEFFALTPMQKVLWHSSAPLWHGTARADVFFVERAGGERDDSGRDVEGSHREEGERVLVCEVNSDTPSGHAEAIAMSRLAGLAPASDPNVHLEARWAGLLRHFLARVDRVMPGSAPVVGIVYPTEIAGDHALIRLYQAWCERLGLRVVIGSPFNLQPTRAGGVAMFDIPCDVILRHYKCDWWAERLPIWDDEAPYPDPDPLDGPIATVLAASLNRRCAVVNPFASVLTQNKRAYAFLWERIATLSPATQAVVRAHVPETIRLEVADCAALRSDRAAWVLKSDYGCEGEEVLIGAVMSDEDWHHALTHAVPARWVAQRHFSARLDAEGQQANHGVYVIGGQAAGLYTRLSRGATDSGARSVAVGICA